MGAPVRTRHGDAAWEIASIANGGTFLGAVCFFWGARLLLVEMASAADTAGAVPGAATRGG